MVLMSLQDAEMSLTSTTHTHARPLPDSVILRVFLPVKRVIECVRANEKRATEQMRVQACKLTGSSHIVPLPGLMLEKPVVMETGL